MAAPEAEFRASAAELAALGTATRPSSLDEEAFVERFGHVYEHSPWIAKAAFSQRVAVDLDSAEDLGRLMEEIVADAGREKQLALLRAHPDLVGGRDVGDHLTDESRVEQRQAGLDACSPSEFERFKELNSKYRARFGFPFIIAVRGLQRSEILEVYERRINNDPSTEFAEALEQVHRIAYLRLLEIP